jgi:hypothetical protein
MAEPEVEAAWRAEFERAGEGCDYLLNGSLTDDTTEETTFRWLGDESEVQRLREEREHHYFLVGRSCAHRSRDCWPHRYRADVLALAPAARGLL